MHPCQMTPDVLHHFISKSVQQLFLHIQSIRSEKRKPRPLIFSFEIPFRSEMLTTVGSVLWIINQADGPGDNCKQDFKGQRSVFRGIKQSLCPKSHTMTVRTEFGLVPTYRPITVPEFGYYYMLSVKIMLSAGAEPGRKERQLQSVKKMLSAGAEPGRKERQLQAFSKTQPPRQGLAPFFADRSASHVSSSVSIKSDNSKGVGTNFSEKTPSAAKSDRSASPVSSSVSMKSDNSKGVGTNFSEKTPSAAKRPNTSVNIGGEMTRWKTLKQQKGIKSDAELATYLLNRIQFETSDAGFQNDRFHKHVMDGLIWTFKDLENKIITFLKNELQRFKKILKKENTEYHVKDFQEDTQNVKAAALDITLHFLRSMNKKKLAHILQDELVFIHQRPLKLILKKKYERISEGIAKHGEFTLLSEVFTDLYITQGGDEQHEINQVQAASRHLESPDIQFKCTHLFKPPGQGQTIRTVLTKGVAGIGKSVSVQKFVLDWAEGRENNDISFIFPLPFREMNLKEKERLSLMDLIVQFFPEIKGVNLSRNDKLKVLFILDGLDECRLPLNFDGNEILRDITSPASLDVLLTNLIKGNLLPSAHIWITTRPAAASKIPPECIDLVTEVRGFNDLQKEEYFRKRFTDENMADTIIDHVKKSKSLFIMCHIPVFCWISATVLQNILEEKKMENSDDTTKTLQEELSNDDTPRTLTQMYTHFFRFQIQQSRRKYDGEYSPDISWDMESIYSLGKLAFEQLEINNLIFYKSDLEDCDIDVSKASVYSGMCTQIFKQETGIILGTVYCFVHMSIQEFIAALYAHLFLDKNKKFVFVQEHKEQENNDETMTGLLKTAVDKALESDNGHLDLFLRFLLGLSLESNRPLLRGLLSQEESNKQNNTEIVQYIKQKFEDNSCPERSINLFYCLNELNDQTLVQEVQKHLSEGSLSSSDLSPAQWSALAFVLLTSDEELEEFELQKFKKSDQCLIRLSPVVKTVKKALLSDCNLTDKSCPALANVLGSGSNLQEINMSNNSLQDSGVKLLCDGIMKQTNKKKSELEILRFSNCDLTEESCSALASALSLDSSSLKELDLSNNDLQDSGIERLSEGLKNNCKLQILSVSECSIGEEGYKSLCSAVRSNPSHLIDLDLRGNDPGETGVKLIYQLLQDHKCSLKTVRFLTSDAAVKAFEYLKKVLHKNPLLNRKLNLSKCKLEESRVKQICELLKDKHCRINTLILSNSNITAGGCADLMSAFKSKPSHLTQLDMSGNKLEDSGMMKISDLLENPKCKLQKLNVSECSIGEEGYKSLFSAVRSNPKSRLKELDLRGNDPGETGVKLIYQLTKDQTCSLKTVRFLKSCAAEEACDYLCKALDVYPLLLKELNLSHNKLGDLDGEKLSALLMDSHNKVTKIILNNCELTENQCSALAAVLSCKTLVKEMNLNNSRLMDSGLKHICDKLKNPQCHLQILNVSECSIGEEGYKSLSSAVRSNPSHLIDLDLRGNDPGETGVKLIYQLLQDHKCSLKTVRFLTSDAAVKAFEYLKKVLHKNPLLEREVNLSDHKLDESRVNQICDLLKDKHCRINTLILSNSSITAGGCIDLMSAFTSNPSHLTHLDLSKNKLEDSGMMKISDLLSHSQCRLHKLNVSECSIGEEGYKSLCSAVRSNPESHLIDLDLRGNDPGETGVKLIYQLTQDHKCSLKTVRFLKSCAAEEACDYLCKALDVYPLLLKELNLSHNKLGDLDGEKLSALLMDSHNKVTKIILNNCELTENQCSALAAVLSCKTLVKEMNLNNSRLMDSGLKHICDKLKNPQCHLQILNLSYCSIGEEGYKSLCSAVRSNPKSRLIDLDLRGNDPGETGVKLICQLTQDHKCALKTVRFLSSSSAVKAFEYLTEALWINPLLERELNLSYFKLDESRVNQICDLLKDQHCRINTLILRDCGLTGESCSALASVLSSNTSLKELDVSNNHLQDSGVKKLQTGLENIHCQLQKLSVSECSIGEEGYKSLCSAVRSNPSHLIDLDLRGNDPGQTGVKLIYQLLQNSKCALETVRLCGCSITEAQCVQLISALCLNLSQLTHLDLSQNKLGHSGIKRLCDLLKHSDCKLDQLELRTCGLTDEGLVALTSALSSNPSHLRTLDLSGNRLGDSGVKHLCALLSNSQCSLETLNLCGCSMTMTQHDQLISALCSNPSHLTELNLSGNKIKDTGVKRLCRLLEHSECKLEKLSLNKCNITDATALADTLAQTQALGFLRELDLSNNKIKELKQLRAVLKGSSCELRAFLQRNSFSKLKRINVDKALVSYFLDSLYL
ncbi:hypothetical protein IRJ41_000684 [Triplophysa rosa]|uniref:NACHT domain-containing protein n=1 Tax=Triplophysa rosa TaxID=992332 RepID=A0A9W7T3E8_TRIRA|nr:hypothetical protein IRJ41_000684 [Triplophysa rosa]